MLPAPEANTMHLIPCLPVAYSKTWLRQLSSNTVPIVIETYTAVPNLRSQEGLSRPHVSQWFPSGSPITLFSYTTELPDGFSNAGCPLHLVLVEPLQTSFHPQHSTKSSGQNHH